MKTIYEKFNKSIIQTLPRVLFEGRIFTVTTASEADRAVEYLLQQTILGFDTETRPSFKRGVVHQVALLQVATEDTCFLFRLNHTGLTDSIVRLLEDTSITKVGLSLKDDIRLLRQRREFTTGTFIDLQDEVKEIGIADCSLQKLYANLLGGMICKRQQLTNWEADILTEAQKYYAATDAWACVRLHKEVEKLKSGKDYLLIKEPVNLEENT
ncbi:MAG: 3'-5' exonuclease domain-containing protein 2 [Bacteroidaceae bacterium]|nr:3'-5' exonuclease domain-containing protein 2 [Bacteroidaceae bacterium]